VCFNILQCVATGSEESTVIVWEVDVALCCSVLQCVAVCRSVLQCVAECCSVLKSVAEIVWEADILKRQLATHCTVRNDYRADFLRLHSMTRAY